MEKKLISKSSVIKPVKAKEVWKVDDSRVEEKCMSPFVVSHIDEISRITGYDLEVLDTEVFVGDFRADIVCQDKHTNDIVVIENQLEASDHPHLGKSLTYLSNIDAKAIVWICESFRDEHKKVIEKLNEITTDGYGFYAVELKFEQYGSNDPYYEFVTCAAATQTSKIGASLQGSLMAQEVSLSLENLVEAIKGDVPTVQHTAYKPYCRLYRKNPVQLYLVKYVRSDETRFEISLNKGTSQSVIDALDSFIAEQLKNYSFVHELGTRNDSIHKWNCWYHDNMTNEQLIPICKDLYTKLKGFKI